MATRDPHRFDPSPKGKRPWVARGWRIISDLVYSNERLDKAGVRIQELEAKLATGSRLRIESMNRIGDLNIRVAELEGEVAALHEELDCAHRRLSELAEPSSGKAWNPVGTDPPPPKKVTR